MRKLHNLLLGVCIAILGNVIFIETFKDASYTSKILVAVCWGMVSYTLSIIIQNKAGL